MISPQTISDGNTPKKAVLSLKNVLYWQEMKRHRVHIYRSRSHLWITILTMIAPFVYLLLFSKIANIASTTLFLDLLVSCWRLLVAYAVAVGLGWLMAVCFYRGRRAIVMLPVFDVLQSFPTFAALPIGVYFWGRTNFTTIFFLVFTIIWPVFFSILSSMKLIKHDWEEAVEIAGLSGWNYLKLFLFPLSIPGLITGSIVGLGEGWEALVATEMIVEMKTGLGPFFQSNVGNVGITMFGILGFLILIFVINKLLWIPLLDWGHHTMEE